ncbi:hypothetical protein CBR_g8611 [Chara braunii]|uniref:RRM domain-containing protein n=1 Tax=Chara braunii TaxID=69332 RepID=A0A388JS39_CHABU|nr:hypothetical protein CBR_g8611 [Chara braunii]|eukprot:GBG60590.1 hypothetical protein CBR_g8611 [Chara braunii]
MVGSQLVMLWSFVLPGTVEYTEPEHAASARKALQHHKEEEWPEKMIINFVKQKRTFDTLGNGHSAPAGAVLGAEQAFLQMAGRMPVGGLWDTASSLPGGGGHDGGAYGVYPPSQLSDNALSYQASSGPLANHFDHFDHLGHEAFGNLLGHGPSMASSYGHSSSGGLQSLAPSLGPPLDLVSNANSSADRTLKVSDFRVQVQKMFPLAQQISLSKKELGAGEMRSGFVTFGDVPTAVAERHRMMLYCDKTQKRPLQVNYSKQAADQRRDIIGGSGVQNPTAVAGRLPGLHHGERLYDARVPDPALLYVRDSKGNPASATLFVDGLPQDVTEDAVRGIFATHPGFKDLKLGTKALTEEEFRTCVVFFDSVANACVARVARDGTRLHGWKRDMVVNFKKWATRR